MKRTMAYILCFLLLLNVNAALAVGRVTPEVPAKPEIRLTFGAWVENTLVPYLQQTVQEKWSAKRCREVVDMVEAGGFPVADKWKDVLYRTKRKHRLHGSEAFLYIVNSQYGENWEMTVEDFAWMQDMELAAGLLPEKRRYAPSAREGAYAEVMSAAKATIMRQYGITEEAWNQYDLSVSFLSGGTEDGGTIKYWEVIVMREWQYVNDFAYRFYPSTGKEELMDERK